MKRNIFAYIVLTLIFSFIAYDVIAEDVTITPVTTQAELVTALNTGGYIQLSNDININTTLTVKADTTLDLNGYMLRQTAELSVINGTSLNGKTLTIKDSRPEENIHYFIAHEDKEWEYVETPEEGVEYKEIKGGIITGGYNKSASTLGGGAIRSNDTKDYIIIDGGTIVGNYAARAGGGSYGGAVTLNNGYVIGNAAGKFAGAIALSGNFTMNGGIIEDNYSPAGTNEYRFNITDISIGSSSNFIMTGGIIKANIATVTSSSSSTLNVSDNAIIYGNIYLQNGIKANITGGKINGRIRMTKGSFTMSGGEITNGTADDTEINYFGSNGGGVSVEGGNFTMSGGTIQGNSANENGGGVYVNGGTFIMNGGNIYNNKSINGGGVFVNSGNATITGGNIGQAKEEDLELGNIATENGGGINVAGGNVTIEGGNVIYNSSNNGAGLYLDGGTFNMSNGYIANNEAENGAGAFITNTTFNLTGGEFNSNIATSKGGGFYVGDNSTVNLSNGEVKNNKAKNGSGFYQTQTSNNTTTELTGNCIVTNNEATNGNGGGVYIDGGSIFRMIGGKIIYNNATANQSTLNVVTAKESTEGVGGGVYILNGTFTMYDDDDTAGNAAIYGNIASYAADDLFASGENTSFDAISVINMDKADAYKTADSWFEDFPENEEHTTLNYEHRNDDDSTNDVIISTGRYKNITDSDDKLVATTVLNRNCNDYIAITMGNSFGKMRINVVDSNVLRAHSFIYKIESCTTEECNDTNPEIVMEIVTQKGNPAIITDMPTGLYRVTVKPTWSWRYDTQTIFEIVENSVSREKETTESVIINVYSEQFTDVNTEYTINNKHWITKTEIVER